jgi:hypothetical protein
MTLMGQMYGVPVCYKFEETSALIEIPQAPIDADFALLREYTEEIRALDEGVANWPQFREENYTFCQKGEGLIQTDGDVAVLSPLGTILWERYQKRWVTYYAPDDVEAAIQSLPDIRRILTEKIDHLRNGVKVEMKQDHRVYDDGNNQNRIYFFSEQGKIYIYRVFEDEEAAKEYIDQPFTDDDRQEILETAKRRRLLASD